MLVDSAPHRAREPTFSFSRSTNHCNDVLCRSSQAPRCSASRAPASGRFRQPLSPVTTPSSSTPRSGARNEQGAVFVTPPLAADCAATSRESAGDSVQASGAPSRPSRGCALCGPRSVRCARRGTPRRAHDDSAARSEGTEVSEAVSCELASAPQTEPALLADVSIGRLRADRLCGAVAPAAARTEAGCWSKPATGSRQGKQHGLAGSNHA